jgi:RNA polymerase sigma factor (sigma-70 family)
MSIEEHYRLHFDTYVKRAFRSLGDRHLAQDAVQESYERAIKYQERITHDNFDAWFNVVFFNTTLKYLNFIRNKGMVMELYVEDTPCLEPLATLEDFLSITTKLKECSLKPKVKEAITMYLIKGYSSEEVSAYLGMSPNAVRSQVKRFKAKLMDGVNAV